MLNKHKSRGRRRSCLLRCPSWLRCWHRSRCRGSAPAPTSCASMRTCRKTTSRSPISRPKTSPSSKTTSRSRSKTSSWSRRARRTRSPSAPIPPTCATCTQQVADAARVFTLFFDRFHVQLSGFVSRAQADHRDARSRDRPRRPGRRDDAGNVARSVTYSRRTGSIERAVTDTWDWGERDRVSSSSTPEEQAIEMCYPAVSRDRSRDDRAHAREADARRAASAGRPSRRAPPRAQVRHGLHRRLAALSPRSDLSRVLDNRVPAR